MGASSGVGTYLPKHLWGPDWRVVPHKNHVAIPKLEVLALLSGVSLTYSPQSDPTPNLRGGGGVVVQLNTAET